MNPSRRIMTTSRPTIAILIWLEVRTQYLDDIVDSLDIVD